MKKLTSILSVFFICVFTLPLFAEQNYDLKQITPAVKSALDGRKARYAELQSLKAQGLLGEDNQGFVSVRQNSGSASDLAKAENRDRKLIYQEIVSQNNLGASGLKQVQNVFAEVQREKARPGDSVQDPSGKWYQK